MRAFAYWLAGQVWGGVPIVLVDSRTPEEAVPQAGRSTVDAVYGQAISDLQAAIPVEERFGAETWIMSLRDNWSRPNSSQYSPLRRI